MTTGNDPLKRYRASSETVKRRAAQQRRRVLIVGPIALIFIADAVSKGGGWELFTAGLIIAGGIVGVMLFKAYARQKNLPPGALWRGNAGIELEDFRASPTLSAYAPNSLGADFMLRTSVAFGFLTLEEDAIAWEPDRTTRKVGAREWRIPKSRVVAAEMGEVPGLPSVLSFLRKVNEGLTLQLDDGSSVSFLVVWATGMDKALDRMGLPGRAAMKP